MVVIRLQMTYTFKEFTTTTTTVTLRFNSHFPDGSGLAGTRTSPFWILLELRMMELASGDNRSCKTCKAPVKSSPPTNQHLAFLRAGCASCRPTNSATELKGNSITTWLAAVGLTLAWCSGTGLTRLSWKPAAKRQSISSLKWNMQHAY